MATAEFSKFAGILSAALSSIIFQDLKELNWNAITSTSFVHSDAFQGLPDFTFQDKLNSYSKFGSNQDALQWVNVIYLDNIILFNDKKV